jgi:glycosyltransferase involved in cell wall biosynthesis
MKVLVVSGDRHVLSYESAAAARLRMQRSAVDALTVFVWPHVHSWWYIWREALRGGYDVITAQDPFYRGMFAWKLTWFTHASLNIQVHTDLDSQSLWRRAIAHFVLRRASSVRAVSKHVAAQVRATGTKAHIHVLPIFLDIERFRALPRRPHEGHMLLWIGRFEKEKNPEDALRVLREVRANIPDATLIMVGSGSMLEQVKRAAGELPVTFPGWADPAKYLPQADVVIATSRYESWGASIIEALAAGVPVVSLEVGIAREAGALIASPEDFAQVTERVLRERPPTELKLSVLHKDAWIKEWKNTLL